MPSRFVVQCDCGHQLAVAPNEVVTCPACGCRIDVKTLLAVLAPPPPPAEHEQ